MAAVERQSVMLQYLPSTDLLSWCPHDETACHLCPVLTNTTALQLTLLTVPAAVTIKGKEGGSSAAASNTC